MDIKKLHEELVNRGGYNKVDDTNIINYVFYILHGAAIIFNDIKLVEKICHDLHYTYDYDIYGDLLNISSLNDCFAIIDSTTKIVSIKQAEDITSILKEYSFLSDNFVYDLLSVASGIFSTNIKSLIFNHFFHIKGDMKNDTFLLNKIAKNNKYFIHDDECLLNTDSDSDVCTISKDRFIRLTDFVDYIESMKLSEKEKNIQTLECKIKKETDMGSIQYNKEYIMIDKCHQNNNEGFVRLILKRSEIRSMNYDLNFFYCYDYYLLTITFIDGTFIKAYVSRGDYKILQECLLK